MIKRFAAVFLMATMLVVAFALGDTAQANGPDYDKVRSLIDQHRSGDQVKLTANDKLGVPTDPKEGVAYQLQSVEIDTETGATTVVDEGVARFYMPVTDIHDDKRVLGDNDLAIYAGTSYDIALDASSDGFASYVVIHNGSAPTEYEFRFTLPGGAKLSEDGKGGIEILNTANEVVGIVAPPWAVDANGAAMQTVFKLRDGVLVQVVEHQGAAYPVVADPDISLGWAVYVRWRDMDENAEDNIEHAKDLLDDIRAANCFGGAIVGPALLGPYGFIFGAIYCLASHFIVSEATDALEEVEDVLLEDDVVIVIPQDCTLMLRLTYLGGLPSRVELEDCGQYTKIYWQLLG